MYSRGCWSTPRRCGYGLLAGYPAAPGSRAAGAVDNGAGETGELPYESGPAVGVDPNLHSRGPTRADRIVRPLSERTANFRGVAYLMVSDQPHQVAVRRKGCHAIEGVGDDTAYHFLTRGAEERCVETGR